ncbi:MAG: hypothetical protein HUJ29_07945 [Gammaproteobacteria bacterium]|nr:hypothetical protein [Gammaproteobacteria bacterium]
MKKYILVLSLSLYSLSAAALEPWSEGTAFTLSQGSSEIGLFSPYRHGLSHDLEISTYPYANLVYPNVSLKKQWTSLGAWRFSTQHAFSYPSLFLDTVSSSGIGGLLPANTQVPQLFSVNNHFYFSRRLANGAILTPRISVELTAGAQPNTMPTIDFPLLYQRTASYHSGFTLNTGVDIDGLIGSNWGYSADLDYYYLPNMNGDSALEHKAMLFYEWNKDRRLLFGYKYVSGSYPFGYDSRTFPMIDLLWSW